MRSIYSSILFPLLFALFCEAYPASDFQEPTAEEFARFLSQYEKLKSDNSDTDMREIEAPDFITEAWNPRRMTSQDLGASVYDDEIKDRSNIETLKELAHDYAVEKRTRSRGAYKYHTCYFNPVSCYGK